LGVYDGRGAAYFARARAAAGKRVSLDGVAISL
jgi:hypothetical protein